MNVSIVIVTFNSEKYIHNCLKSILKNFKKNNSFEIIIFDYNSSDNTLKIVRDINDLSIKIIYNQVNKGYSKAINDSIDIAKYENIFKFNHKQRF